MAALDELMRGQAVSQSDRDALAALMRQDISPVDRNALSMLAAGRSFMAPPGAVWEFEGVGDAPPDLSRVPAWRKWWESR